MKCKCGELLVICAVYDDPDTGYAYNLFQCVYCGVIIKKDVWNNKGTLTIDLDNSINKIG